jgi:hypothetical protein
MYGLALILCLVLLWPNRAVAATETQPSSPLVEGLTAVLLTEEDVGPAFVRVEQLSGFQQSDWLAFAQTVFLEVPTPSSVSYLPHLVASGAGWPIGVAPSAPFERFVEEQGYGESNPLQYQPVDGPAVGDYSQWYASTLPWISQDGVTRESESVPHAIQAVAFRQGSYFGLIAVSGAPDFVSQTEVLEYAQLMATRMGSDLKF